LGPLHSFFLMRCHNLVAANTGMLRVHHAALFGSRAGCSPSRLICSAQVTRSSFIARAKNANDASVLLGPFTSTGSFDRVLEEAGVVVSHIGPDEVTCNFAVSDSSCNNFGTLHGGFIALLVDVVGTLALLGRDPSQAGVSVEMNQSFCTAARKGEPLTCTGTVLRYGQTLAFTQVVLRKTVDAKLIATGRHTKMFLR